MGNRAKVKHIFPTIERYGASTGSRQVAVQFRGSEVCCPYCGRPHPWTPEAQSQLPAAEAAQAILSLFEQGQPRQLVFAGGEPLVYEDWIRRLLALLPACRVQVKTTGLPVQALAALLPHVSLFSLQWSLERMDKLLATQRDVKYALQLLALRDGELILQLPAPLLGDVRRLQQRLDEVQALLAAAPGLPVWLALPTAASVNTSADLQALAACLDAFPSARIVRTMPEAPPCPWA